MESEQFICFVIAVMSLISGVGLALVKIDKNELQKRIHSFPQMALFRFPVFRWGIVAVCLAIGTIAFLAGLR